MSADLKETILNLLVREFEYSQSLHSEREDIMEKLGIESDTLLDETLQALQQEGFVHLWSDYRGKIKLAKITVDGLNKFGDVKLRYGL
ncbi:MAG: hypothetical protein ACFFFG_15810 [Candidatus Thorarchaeota archaeon]